MSAIYHFWSAIYKFKKNVGYIQIPKKNVGYIPLWSAIYDFRSAMTKYRNNVRYIPLQVGYIP